jgi:hypothetical protein
MLKYPMIIILSLFILSCGNSNDDTTKKENNPCENYLCENSECQIDIGANTPYCKCNDGYILSPNDKHSCIKKEIDLCINKQCAENEECNSENGECVCKSGFIKKDNVCIEDVTDLCENKQCQENEECNSENGECICKEGFERIENICSKITTKHAVMIYGDNRDHEAEVGGFPVTIDSKHPKVVAAMMREINSNEADIKYIFNSRDLVWDGKDPENKEWNDFFDEIKPFIDSGITYYPVLGNHEHNSENYFNLFELPENERYYHVDLYGIRFLALDSNSDLTEGSEQRNWLIDKLDNLPNDIKFVVAIYHHPTFSTGHHGDDGDKTELRNILHPLFVEKGVDIVFNGHDHAYEHLVADGINYFVTGGGGAILDQTRLSIGDYEYSKKFEGQKYHYCLLTIENDIITIEAKEANSNNGIFDTVTIHSHR